MRKACMLVLLLPLAACLRLTGRDVGGTIGCKDGIDIKYRWGVWIDGRNAIGGRFAYGKDYTRTMDIALSNVHHMASLPSARTGLTLELFNHIRDLLDIGWRFFPNPMFKEIKTCFEVFPPSKIASITGNVSEKDLFYEPAEAGDFNAGLTTLFANYNARIAVAKPNDALNAIADLMRHLAWMHPLSDRNGRSRLLLLQFELRRNNIGCGTMMYNNNKNIYFDSLDVYVAKIQEGIKMYNRAQESDELKKAMNASCTSWLAKNEARVCNPWLQPSSVETRVESLSDSEADALEACWARIGGVYGTSPLWWHP